MSTELLLLRHAKSDWHTGTETDHARPLNERGRQAAPRMGRFMLQQGLIPDRILCSTATRTRETCTGLQTMWPHKVPTEYLDAIYEARLDVLRKTIAPHLADGTRLLVIGHNPGMEHLLHHLIPAGAHPAMGQGYPTCTLAQIALPGPGLAEGSGELLRLEFVKRLKTGA